MLSLFPRRPLVRVAAAIHNAHALKVRACHTVCRRFEELSAHCWCLLCIAISSDLHTSFCKYLVLVHLTNGCAIGSVAQKAVRTNRET